MKNEKFKKRYQLEEHFLEEYWFCLVRHLHCGKGPSFAFKIRAKILSTATKISLKSGSMNVRKYREYLDPVKC